MERSGEPGDYFVMSRGESRCRAISRRIIIPLAFICLGGSRWQLLPRYSREAIQQQSVITGCLAPFILIFRLARKKGGREKKVGEFDSTGDEFHWLVRLSHNQ